MSHRITRRQFATIAGGTGVGGFLCVDTLLAQIQQQGGLSRDSVKILIAELTDLKLSEEEIDKVKSSLERSLRSIRVIRAYELEPSIEPATVFVPRR